MKDEGEGMRDEGVKRRRDLQKRTGQIGFDLYGRRPYIFQFRKYESSHVFGYTNVSSKIGSGGAEMSPVLVIIDLPCRCIYSTPENVAFYG